MVILERMSVSISFQAMCRSKICLVEFSYRGVRPPVPIERRVENPALVGQLTDNVSKLEKKSWPFY